MTGRITRRFSELRRQGKKAFIAYVMTGDPDLDRTGRLVAMLEECGADMVELGVPFSDPLADGPAIQQAAQRALANHVSLQSCIGFVAGIRDSTKMPILLMTYYNPVFRYGDERFVEDAKAAGVDGVIIPDLPPEEAKVLLAAARKHGLETVFLLAPTSTAERIAVVARHSTGFIYYVPITGITGSKLSIDASLGEQLARIRSVSGKPVAVGFGVSTPEEASAVAAFSDGVIVGSAIVRRSSDSDEELRAYLASLRQAIR